MFAVQLIICKYCLNTKVESKNKKSSFSYILFVSLIRSVPISGAVYPVPHGDNCRS